MVSDVGMKKHHKLERLSCALTVHMLLRETGASGQKLLACAIVQPACRSDEQSLSVHHCGRFTPPEDKQPKTEPSEWQPACTRRKTQGHA